MCATVSSLSLAAHPYFPPESFSFVFRLSFVLAEATRVEMASPGGAVLDNPPVHAASSKPTVSNPLSIGVVAVGERASVQPPEDSDIPTQYAKLIEQCGNPCAKHLWPRQPH